MLYFAYFLLADVEAETLRKKKCEENQKIKENKLSLAQINGRLSELQDKRHTLEEEKRALLNEAKDGNISFSLNAESKWYILYYTMFILYTYSIL